MIPAESLGESLGSAIGLLGFITLWGVLAFVLFVRAWRNRK